MLILQHFPCNQLSNQSQLVAQRPVLPFLQTLKGSSATVATESQRRECEEKSRAVGSGSVGQVVGVILRRIGSCNQAKNREFQ